ncbi:MAG TPA: hypothetical protein VH877_14770 [Polyangia bacterium]|jgi:hypothetical protein|nr:hypothetical protein [Polyangia bacterium]
MKTEDDKDGVADRLIDWHFRVEPEITKIYRIFSPEENAPGEPIKLLEVNLATFCTGSVQAFAFGPADDIPYPSVVAEVTPEEMDQILAHKIALPRGWSIEAAKEFTRRNHEGSR